MHSTAARRISTVILATCLAACGSGSDTSIQGSASVAPEADTPLNPLPPKQVIYTASTVMTANPERGMYNQVDCNQPINVDVLRNYRSAQGDSLVMCVFHLDDFMTMPLSTNLLEFFHGQMDAIRAAGAKVILRFAYNFEENAVDAAPAAVHAHLDQLAPFLAAHKDIVAMVQAGFIGSWGEWGDSYNFGMIDDMTTANLNDRQALLNKLLQTVPAERMVQVRTPGFKRLVFGATPVISGEAFSGSGKARVGHHNDCFLASDNDAGTYTDIPTEYAYLAGDTTYTVMGGETCEYAPPRSDCPTALAELAAFHWSYLNGGFQARVLDAFRAQGCFDEIKRKLGYRFILEQGTYTSNAQPGGTFSLDLVLRNDGWATPYNARDAELVLRHSASGALYRFHLNTDPRRWLPGQPTVISQNLQLPSDMPAGDYSALLDLPDPMPSLRNRPEYSIQLANLGTWEAATGFNNLHHTLKLTTAASLPGSR